MAFTLITEEANHKITTSCDVASKQSDTVQSCRAHSDLVNSKTDCLLGLYHLDRQHITKVRKGSKIFTVRRMRKVACIVL